MTIFSGGTFFNLFVNDFKLYTHNFANVMPVSDNGGSSGILLSLFGGPSIGDIRSRLIRLAPDHPIKALLEMRIAANGKDEAAEIWKNIVQGYHPLWQAIPSSMEREFVRSLFDKIDTELRKNSHLGPFDFRGASVGNLFFMGSKFFFKNSLPNAIDFYKRLTKIPESIHVIPIVDSKQQLALAARLMNEDVIYGQNEISHPGVGVNKSYSVALPAPIRQLFYVEEASRKVINPLLNPSVSRALQQHDHIIYSGGSGYTSIMPNLIVRGVGEAIAEKSGVKLVILNGEPDRELLGVTSAMQYLEILRSGLNRYGELNNPLNAYVNRLVVPEPSGFVIDFEELRQAGITVVRMPFMVDSATGLVLNTPQLPLTLMRTMAAWGH